LISLFELICFVSLALRNAPLRIHGKNLKAAMAAKGVDIATLASAVVTPGKGINNQDKAESAVKNWMRDNDHPRCTAKYIGILANAIGVAPASIAKFTCIFRYERGSPRKTKLLTDLIRGKSYDTAANLLAFNTKRAAVDVHAALKTALNDAERADADTTKLFVIDSASDEGPMMKRFNQKDRGRAHRILKRMTHITISLAVKG